MIIRNFTIDDYEQVYSLWSNTEGLQLDPVDDSKDGIASFIQKNPTSSFVAEKEGRIIGVILCGSDGRRGYIYHAVVSPAYRNQGIASQMMEHVMLSLKELGIHKSALLVFQNNQKGNSFWSKIGYLPKDHLLYRSIQL